MASKLCKNISRGFCLIYKPMNRSYSIKASSYPVPTYEEIEEYTETIASNIYSWPSNLRDHFITTLHKAQANPRRNKSYQRFNIPREYLEALDIDKFRHWLPYVFVTDVVEVMNQIQESPNLSLIKINDEMVTYDEENTEHKEQMDLIKSKCTNKMIWIRDIPNTVSDRKLLETFKQFGTISAITMDRLQCVRQQKWLKHKEEERKQLENDELTKTIKKLKQNLIKNMVNDYQQEYLKVRLAVNNYLQILRRIMAHLQHQFDLNDAELIDNGRTLLVPIYSDHSASRILSVIKESTSAKFFFENGNIIISAQGTEEQTIRQELDKHYGVESFKKISHKDGIFELEIVFASKLESSIREFINTLCSKHFDIALDQISMSLHAPYQIPTWYRNMTDLKRHDSKSFFSGVGDTDSWSISQRMKMGKKNKNDDDDTAFDATCNACIHFDDAESVETILCNEVKIWGMVINGARCRVSKPPKQVILKNVPFDYDNPVRLRPYYTHSRKGEFNGETEYDVDGNVIPPIIKRSVQPQLSHIPMYAHHSQCCAPLTAPHLLHCDGLKSIFVQSTRFAQDFMSRDYMDTRLQYEVPHLSYSLDVSSHHLTVGDKTRLLMKESKSFNMALPLIGGVIQYMLVMDEFDVWRPASCAFEEEELFWYFDEDVSVNAIRNKTIKKILKKNNNYSFDAQKGRVWVYSRRYRKIDIVTHGLMNEVDGDQPTFVCIDGIKYSFGNKNEAMVLQKGWNEILIEFGDVNAANGSFQIVDFYEQSEINDLYWRYSPPSINLILYFENYLSANKMYNSLKNAEFKKYGARIEMSEFDDEYLKNNAVLQGEVVGSDDESSAFKYQMNGHVDERSSLEQFANTIMKSIHASNTKFEKRSHSKRICEETRRYEQMLSEYSPSQMLQYGDDKNDSEYNNTTQVYNIGLNVPTTLELIQNEKLN